MRRTRKIILSIAGAAVLAVSGTMAAIAWGHGYNSDPPSRSALCASGAVADCGAISYEPQSVEGPKGFPAAGPADGELCAGGNAPFAELDDPRGGNWPTTSVSAGPRTFTWTMTVAHSTATFDYYITNANYDPTRPLTRDQLDLTPFASFAMGGAQPDHSMTHTVTLPQRSGQQLIFGVWVIADTANAFYSCIDVDFGGGGSGPGPEPTDPPTTPGGGGGEACDAGAWSASAVYNGGDEVTHNGTSYRASWWTTGEEPGTTGEWGVWRAVTTC
ncbi:lytic polysaccharide monooxygenase [Glycomyces sp. NRRL B-16210]|uniref:lytic polysaccharide monooxygenase n=1 Tax=Glycomyces sp. NRRL B-16210 TaxID=1463821 RepID=UPI0004BFACF0|nr:lytic polysaccharide monooxygenase [Glycomyces sp. NRRL B-16210]